MFDISTPATGWNLRLANINKTTYPQIYAIENNWHLADADVDSKIYDDNEDSTLPPVNFTPTWSGFPGAPPIAIAIAVAIQPSQFKEVPFRWALRQNYPNPFNPETWIPFELSQDADVTIRIYNAKGQLVRTLALGAKRAGYHVEKPKAAYWDGRNDAGGRVASGIYFYQLQAGQFISTRKMVILK